MSLTVYDEISKDVEYAFAAHVSPALRSFLTVRKNPRNPLGKRRNLKENHSERRIHLPWANRLDRPMGDESPSADGSREHLILGCQKKDNKLQENLVHHMV